MATMDDYVSSHFMRNSHITLLPLRVNYYSLVFFFETLILVSITAITSGILSKQYKRSCKSKKFFGRLLILQ